MQRRSVKIAGAAALDHTYLRTCVAMTSKCSVETRRERRDQAGKRRPPGPKGLPFLGNLLDFSRDVLRYYGEWAQEYGDIVTLRLGAWPAVLLNHSDYAEYVLVRNHRNF